MQKKAILDLKNMFFEFCNSELSQKQDLAIRNEDIHSFISPCRMVLWVENIANFQEVDSIQKIGPKIDSPKRAIEGFARSVNVKNISDLEIIENKKGKYYAFNEEAKKIATKDILKQNLPLILQKNE